jgi:hypothetical protein
LVNVKTKLRCTFVAGLGTILVLTTEGSLDIVELITSGLSNFREILRLESDKGLQRSKLHPFILKVDHWL